MDEDLTTRIDDALNALFDALPQVEAGDFQYAIYNYSRGIVNRWHRTYGVPAVADVSEDGQPT
jgi:hypothetical protein